MKKVTLAILLFVLCAPAVHAETKSENNTSEPTKAQSAQQEKMKACNGEAKEKKLKGEERKTFMSGCLKKKPA